MRKCICVLFCIQMLFRASSVALAEPPQPALAAFMDTQGFLDSLGDWILGSDWGILRGSIDPEGRTVTLFLPQDSLDALTEQDRDDIRGAMLDMLSRALPSREAARGFEILFRAEGAPEAKRPDGSAARPPAGAEKAVRNLVFIHHSVGENWLREGLANALNARGYHVADITYGWREVGDRTDTADWPTYRDK